MIEQDLLKKHYVGRDGFIWWIGQVASDSWKQNKGGSSPEPTNIQEGFAYRYQVRIMGYHTADASQLPDVDLPWASVMYPVTAGSGAPFFESPNLKRGDFVYGFFIDGENAQQPVIMGIIGYNEYQDLSNNPTPFNPFRGTSTTGPIASFSIAASSAATPADSNGSESSEESNTGSSSSDVRTGVSDRVRSAAEKIEEKHAKKKVYLNCAKKGELKPDAMKLAIQNMIQDVQDAQQGLKNFQKSITHPIQFEGQQITVQEYIRIQVDRASEFVSSNVITFLTDMQQWVVRKINAGLQDVYFILFPDKQQAAKEGVEVAMDTLSCLFKRIIKNVLNMVRKALLQVVNRYVNVPLCAAENILAAILGKLSGLINGAIAQIMGPINKIVGGAVSIAADVLSFVEDVLNFLDCDPKPECPEIKEWSLWDGPDEDFSILDPTSIIDKVKGFASTVSDVVDPDNFDFGSIDFSDVFQTNCNTDAIFCGPPKVEFWGGGGSNAAGNVIVSAVGDILGVDMVNGGSGYTRKPFVKFIDDCGKGNGASGTAIIEDEQVVGVIINDPGYGYLPVPDGSQGGDGRTWAEANQTTVQRPDGIWEIPFSPGEVVSVFPGDLVRIPPGSTADVGGQLLPGGVSTVITNGGDLTVPVPTDTQINPGDLPIRDDEAYPVITFLCDYIIANPGYNYQPDDKIVIEPSNGAEMIPTFNELGQLTNIKITSSGQGFKQIPNIYIESETGYNAKIVPRFCVDRVGEDDYKDPTIQDKIVSVIDCVGKV